MTVSYLEDWQSDTLKTGVSISVEDCDADTLVYALTVGDGNDAFTVELSHDDVGSLATFLDRAWDALFSYQLDKKKGTPTGKEGGAT